jgi:hypothetical protein
VEPALHIHDPFASDPPKPRFPWPSYGVSDLDHLPQADVHWIVKGLLAQGCLTELTADIRAGKTTFTAQLVRAMRERRPFLGQPTSWARVTWLSEEPPVSFRQAMHRAHLESAGAGEVCCIFRQDVATVTWPTLIEHCTRSYHGSPGLLIVDTLSRFVGVGPDQENDPAIAAKALEPLLQAAKQGLTVMVHRHARKSGGDVATAGRGSSAWSADTAIMLLLRRPVRNGDPDELAIASRSRILESASRFTETPAQDEPVTIALSPDGYGIVSGDTARQQRFDDIDEQILLFVASHPGCTKRDVRETNTIRAKALLRDDRVVALITDAKLREEPVTRTDSRGRTRSYPGLFIGPLA